MLSSSLSTRLLSLSSRSIRAFTTSKGSSLLEETTYIHPLSQLVLQHLQNARGDWVQAQGLDRGLSIHKDGTFALKFPDSSTEPPDMIWTSYEPVERKHWLTVHRGDLVGRYLLQDNTKTAWSDNKSTPDKIAQAVDEMIAKISSEQS